MYPQNRKYQTMYDRLAPGYDIAERLYRWVSRKPDYRLEHLRKLEILPGARVFENLGWEWRQSALSSTRHRVIRSRFILGHAAQMPPQSEALATQHTTVPGRSRAASVPR